jgi:hypothetical protein
MKILLLQLGVFLCLVFPFKLSAQTTISPENLSKITFVYGESWVQDNPDIVIALNNLLENRISIVNENLSSDEKFPNITTLPLFNKLNPSVSPTNFETFVVEDFNPLTYHFDFFTNKTQVFRLGGSSYIMIVQPSR